MELINRLMGREQRGDSITTDGESENFLKTLTKRELEEHLKKRQMKLGGRKSDLIDRLMGRDMSAAKEWKKSDAKKLLERLINDERSHVHRMTQKRNIFLSSIV